MEQSARMRWVAAVFLLVGCREASAPTTTRGAVFFRDFVPGYQMVASREYTLSAFGSAWEHVEYLEATPTDDGRVRCLDAIRARAAADATGSGVHLHAVTHARKALPEARMQASCRPPVDALLPHFVAGNVTMFRLDAKTRRVVSSPV